MKEGSPTVSCISIKSVVLITAALLLAWPVASSALPSVDPLQGTIGTQVTISGGAFGTAGGKVWLDVGGKAVKFNVTSWADDVIQAVWKTKAAPGVYGVFVQGKRTDSAQVGTFEIRLPEIGTFNPPNGSPGETVTLNGNFFGSPAKPKVYLSQPGGKRKKCKVTSPSMTAIPLLVPKLPEGVYDVQVVNKIGPSPLASGVFRIGPPTGTIGPGGGTVTSSSGKVRIVIPPGALTEETSITIKEGVAAPSGHVGDAYEFGPQGLSFLLPVSVTIAYDKASLPPGLGETSLRLGTLLSGLQWCEILGSSIDTGAKTVTGQTQSFSTYGLVIGAFSSTIEGSQEVPASASLATGKGVFSVDTAKNILAYQISWEALEGEEQSAAICGPASRGQNGDVLHTLPLGPYKTGIWIYDESMEQDILTGRIYVNISSAAYPNGEIRGQIEPLGPPGTTGAVTLRIALWDDLSGSGPSPGTPVAVSTMKVRVSGPGMAPMEEGITVTTGGLIEEAITIPKGGARRIDLLANDATTQLIYQASAFFDLLDDSQTITLVMMGTSDVTPPVFAGLTGVTQIDCGTIDLTWLAATDDKADTADIAYLIYIAQSAGGENFATPSYATKPGETGYTVSGLAPGKTYYFVVRAMDPAGNIDVNTVEMSGSTFSSGTGIYVDVNTGADTSDCGAQISPCKTITRALAMTAGNEDIHVAEGLYNEASGETFPLQLKAGTSLLGRIWLKPVAPAPTAGVQPVVMSPLAMIRSSSLSSVILGAANAFIGGFIIQLGPEVAGSAYPIIDSDGHAITVKNCALYGVGNSGFSEGVKIASGSKVQNSLISGFAGGGGHGILAWGGSSKITSNTIVKNTVGLSASGDVYMIKENTIKKNVFGISLGQGGGGLVYRNWVSENYVGIQLQDPSLVKSPRVTGNTIIMNENVGLTIFAGEYQKDHKPVLVSLNAIYFNSLGVEVRNWAKANVNFNDLSCNRIWNMYVGYSNADTRVDARYNAWEHLPPVLDPGRPSDPGCYPATDVDICYEAYYSLSPPPPHTPSFQGGCGKFWGM